MIRGLWYICKEGQEIFKDSEILFRANTSKFVQNLSYKKMVHKLINNMQVKHNYNKIIAQLDIDVDEEISEDLLVCFYVFVAICMQRTREKKLN